MAAHTVAVGCGNIVKHHVQAGVSAHDNRLRRHVQHAAKQTLGLRQAVQQAVVAHIQAIFGGIAIAGIDAFQHVQRQIQLLLARLAAGHIQLQPAGAVVLVGFLQLQLPRQQGLTAHILQFFGTDRHWYLALSSLIEHNMAHYTPYRLFLQVKKKIPAKIFLQGA